MNAPAFARVIPFPSVKDDSLAAFLMDRHALRPSRRRMVRLHDGVVAELVASDGSVGVVRLADGTLSAVGKVPRGAA